VQSLLNLDAPKKTGKEALRLSNADIDADLNRWASAHPCLIDVRLDALSAEPLLYQAPISADAELTLELAINQRHLAASTWFVSSFSSLKNRSIADTLPEEANEWRDLGAESGDYQEFSVAAVVAETPEILEAAMFPRGTVAGKCLHRILELLDFTQDIAQSDGLILGQLQLFGFEAHYLDSAKRLLQQTLQAPITPARKTLAQMTVGQRLDELSFVFPIKNLNLSRFKSVLSHADSGLHPACRKAAEQLQATHLTGYLKGYIDLVLESEGKLYLIDYKSNLLESYDQTHLAEAMAHAHYYLQYLLYSIALKRYVTARGHDFEAVFGGVRYLFVRGLDENGLGIWHDRPSAALLSALEACF
jgi:exodeoxyribonuclease V beta subunit